MATDLLRDTHSPGRMTLNEPGFDRTFVPPGQKVTASPGPSAPVAAAPAVAAGGSLVPGRTTVLPRVDWNGPVPELSQTARDRFSVQSQLGEGGMGEVLLVEDHDVGRKVAVKRLHPDQQHPAAIARFVDEIRTAARLDHPHIAPLHDVGVDAEGRYFFVMKHVEGETLERLIERLASGERDAHGQWPYIARAQLFLDILQAVAHAHRQGLIHRDIKPANIMVGRHGTVTVMDWGLAKRVGSADHIAAGATGTVEGNRTVMGELLGTPAYMAPEQARGEHDKVDERSDVYALGVLLHELLFLQHYLSDATDMTSLLIGVTEREIDTHNNPKSGPPVPIELGYFARRAMQKDPAARFQSVDGMVDELKAVLDGDFRVECPVTFTKKGGRMLVHQFDRWPRMGVMVTGVVALLAVFGAISTVRLLVG